MTTPSNGKLENLLDDIYKEYNPGSFEEDSWKMYSRCVEQAYTLLGRDIILATLKKTGIWII